VSHCPTAKTRRKHRDPSQNNTILHPTWEPSVSYSMYKVITFTVMGRQSNSEIPILNLGDLKEFNFLMKRCKFLEKAK